MDQQFFELVQKNKQKEEISCILTSNNKTEHFGLALSSKEAEELVVCRNSTLKKYNRVELGNGILDKIIFTFCDSQYISQDNYLESLEKLQDIFYQFKNETNDRLSDDELLTFMREQFEGVCFGDVEYLESTCLARFAKAVRSGYKKFTESGGHNEYEEVDEEQRWDNDLYMQVAKELFWG